MASQSSAASRNFVLFDFSDGHSGFGYISAIKRPNVPKHTAIATVESYIKEKTQLTIRWPITQIDKPPDVWNLTDYVGRRNQQDCLHRAGVAIAVSADKEFLTKERDHLMKSRQQQQPGTTAGPTARRQLNYPCEENTAASHHQQDPQSSSTSSTQPGDLLPLAAQKSLPVAHKKRPAPESDQVERISSLEAKVAKLETELAFTRQALDETNEEKVELLEEKTSLLQQLEELRTVDHQLNPVQLKKILDNHVSELRSLINTSAASINGSPHRHSAGYPTPTSTPLPSTPTNGAFLPNRAEKMVQIGDKGDIKVPINILRDAVALGREGSSKEHLNAMVGRMIEAFIPDANDRAKYSLTGRECRSIPKEQRVKKMPFPKEYADAIASYTTARWERWYKRALTRTEINAAITAKFTNSHTSVKNQKKRQLGADVIHNPHATRLAEEMLDHEVLVRNSNEQEGESDVDEDDGESISDNDEQQHQP